MWVGHCGSVGCALLFSRRWHTQCGVSLRAFTWSGVPKQPHLHAAVARKKWKSSIEGLCDTLWAESEAVSPEVSFWLRELRWDSHHHDVEMWSHGRRRKTGTAFGTSNEEWKPDFRHELFPEPRNVRFGAMERWREEHSVQLYSQKEIEDFTREKSLSIEGWMAEGGVLGTLDWSRLPPRGKILRRHSAINLIDPDTDWKPPSDERSPHQRLQDGMRELVEIASGAGTRKPGPPISRDVLVRLQETFGIRSPDEEPNWKPFVEDHSVADPRPRLSKYVFIPSSVRKKAFINAMFEHLQKMDPTYVPLEIRDGPMGFWMSLVDKDQMEGGLQRYLLLLADNLEEEIFLKDPVWVEKERRAQGVATQIMRQLALALSYKLDVQNQEDSKDTGDTKSERQTPSPH